MIKNKIYIILALIVSVLFILSMSPFFGITSVDVVGNKNISTNEILEKTNLVILNRNIFTYSANKYEKELKANAYFENANIRKILPNKIIVEVKERTLDFYVLHSKNTYLYMSEDGKILDAKQNYTISLPIIKGLNFDTFTIGQTLSVNDQEALNNAIILINTIKRYGSFEDQIVIDVSDSKNISILVNNVNIIFGDISDCDLKVRRSIAAIPAIEPELKGYLYVNDVNRNTYFKLIR